MISFYMFLGSTLRAAAALATAALAVGCAYNNTQLHIDDTSTPNLSARALHRFGAGPGGGGLELEVSTVHASGEQRLGAGATAALGTQVVTGPVVLNHSARVQHAQMVYNHLLFAGRPIELEWFAGGAWVNASWESMSSNAADPRLVSQAGWYGPAGGALGRLRLAPHLALELRYSAAVDLSSGLDTGSRNSTELVLAFKPAPWFTLRAGVGESRSWLRPEFVDSELSVRVRGPFFSLGFEL